MLCYSRLVDVKEMHLKAWCTCRAVVLLIKPTFFLLASSLSSSSYLLKVPIIGLAVGREIAALDGLSKQSHLHCKENCQQLGSFRSHQTSKLRWSIVRNSYHFKDLEVVFSSYYWTSCGAWDCRFGWLERTMFERNKPYKSQWCKCDISAPHIAFGMSNNIESKNKKVFA